jgi:hypothetical protein
MVEAHHVAVPDVAGDASRGGRRPGPTTVEPGMTGSVPTDVAVMAMLGALPVGAVIGAWLITVFGRPAEPPPVSPPAHTGRHRA